MQVFLQTLACTGSTEIACDAKDWPGRVEPESSIKSLVKEKGLLERVCAQVKKYALSLLQDLSISQPDIVLNTSFDDEIAALALQLEEINCRDENSKGKNRADESPDIDLTVSAYQSDVQAHIQFLHDLKLAHGIACAVDTDGQAIPEATRGESQAQRDRQLALPVNEGGNEEAEALPPKKRGSNGLPISTMRKPMTKRERSRSVNRLCEAPGKGTRSPMDTSYSVCTNRFRQCDVRRLQCEHIYCNDCLKELSMRSTKDETLFPPTCCRQPIPWN